MGDWLVAKLLKFIGSKLDGYKTKIGGVGFILIGVLGLVRIAMPDQTQLPDMDITTALGSISAGITALGVAGKAEKLTAAVVAAKSDALMSNTTEVTK